MKHKVRHTLATVALLVLSGVVMSFPAHAQVIFLTGNTTINSLIGYNYYGGSYAYIGVDAIPPARADNTSPTVELLPGARCNELYAYNRSVIDVAGGFHGKGSPFDRIEARDNSSVTIRRNDATVSGYLCTYDNSVAGIDGGYIRVESSGHSAVSVSGGLLNSVSAYDNSVVTIYGCNLALVYEAPHCYLLRGYLADGTRANCQVYITAAARVNLCAVTIIKPRIVLTGATTLDARSVSVNYSISVTPVDQPLRFDIYRCHTPSLDTRSEWIGTQTIDPEATPAYLQTGNHTIALHPGTPLRPNPALSYVVVVANSNEAVLEDPSSVNSAYFRKFLLGGIAHGFSFTDSDTYAWTNQMKQDLVNIAGYNGVSVHDWTKASKLPQPDLAIKAGNDMWGQLCQAAQCLMQHDGHPGDVVDLHLFGHSRGTVVVSQVLADMIVRPNTAFQGSYVEATLLDIHPANVTENNLLSYTPNILSTVALALTHDIQSKAQDPEITLPQLPALMSVDIWYQHTPSYKFVLNLNVYESGLNLWGEGINSNRIKDQWKIPIQWHDLTSQMYTVGGQTFLIGHTEIHEYYRLFQIDQGLVH